MIPPTPNELLDLRDGIGLVASSVRFDVTKFDDVIGALEVERDLVSITNSTGASVMRIMRGVNIKPSDLDELDPFVDTLRPQLVLSDDSEWPLGEYFFTNVTRRRQTTPRPESFTMWDGWFLLNQEMPMSFGVLPGGKIVDALTQLIVNARVLHYDIEPSDAFVLDPLNWPMTTQRGQIVRDLAALLGYVIYFDASGVFRAHPPLPLAEVDAHVYEIGDASRVYDDTADEVDDLLSAPGVHRVVSVGPTRDEITGSATVPPSSPLYPGRRRVTITKTHRVQGVSSTDHATAMARSYASTDPRAYETVSFDAAPDPRHDTYEVVQYDGLQWRELSWTLRLTPAGPHSHTIARTVDRD